MEEYKKKNQLFLLLIFFVILSFILIGFICYEKWMKEDKCKAENLDKVVKVSDDVNKNVDVDILTEETKEQEVEKYRKEIEKQKEEGLTEEQIIKSFKSIEEIQKEIYLSRGINPEKISQKKGSIYKKLEELFQVIHRIVEAMSKNNAKENIKIIIDIIVLLLLVCILKIPFILIVLSFKSLYCL